MNDESVDDDSKAKEKEDVVNHCKRLQMQQNPIYKSRPKRRISIGHDQLLYLDMVRLIRSMIV